jgi:hypothetical protein
MFRPYLGHLQVVMLYTSEKTTLSLHEKHYSLVSLLDGSSVGPVGTSYVEAGGGSWRNVGFVFFWCRTSFLVYARFLSHMPNVCGGVLFWASARSRAENSGGFPVSALWCRMAVSG